MFTLALHLMVNRRVLLADFNKKYKYPRVQNQIHHLKTRLTSRTATSWPLRSRRKAKGCLLSRPGLTSQPRRGSEAMWLFRSSRSLWRSSWLSFRRHQRSRQRLLDNTFRYPVDQSKSGQEIKVIKRLT